MIVECIMGGGEGEEWKIAWTLLLHKGEDLGVNASVALPALDL